MNLNDNIIHNIFKIIGTTTLTSELNFLTYLLLNKNISNIVIYLIKKYYIIFCDEDVDKAIKLSKLGYKVELNLYENIDNDKLQELKNIIYKINISYFDTVIHTTYPSYSRHTTTPFVYIAGAQDYVIRNYTIKRKN